MKRFLIAAVLAAAAVGQASADPIPLFPRLRGYRVIVLPPPKAVPVRVTETTEVTTTTTRTVTAPVAVETVTSTTTTTKVPGKPAVTTTVRTSSTTPIEPKTIKPSGF